MVCNLEVDTRCESTLRIRLTECVIDHRIEHSQLSIQRGCDSWCDGTFGILCTRLIDGILPGRVEYP